MISKRVRTAEWSLHHGSIPGKDKRFSSLKASRLALGPTQPPLLWIPGAHAVGSKMARAWRHSPHAVPRLRISWVMPPFSQGHSWYAQRQFYLYLYHYDTASINYTDNRLSFMTLHAFVAAFPCNFSPLYPANKPTNQQTNYSLVLSMDHKHFWPGNSCWVT